MAEEETAFSYKKALKEIEQIVAKIESEEPDVDEMSKMVKRAAMLIKQCKEKLRNTGEDIDNILGEFEE